MCRGHCEKCLMKFAAAASAASAAGLLQETFASAPTFGAGFLNVADHFRITVRLTSLARTARDRYEATADMTPALCNIQRYPA